MYVIITIIAKTHVPIASDDRIDRNGFFELDH